MKAGIIGYGNIGKLRHKEMDNNKDYEVVSICETYNPPKYQNIRTYSNYRDMIKEEALDCVFVCVPHTITTPIVIEALKQDINTFAEKPPGITLKDTLKIKKYLHKGTKLKFGFNHRYHYHIQEAKRIIESGELGKIEWIKGTYGSVSLGDGWRIKKETGGRGILLSQGIHMIDLFRYLSNSEFELQKSIISHFDGHWYEDNVFAILSSPKNRIDGMLHSSAVMRRNIFLMYIGMERGYIRIGNLITSTRSFGFPEEICVANSDKTYFYGNPQKTSRFYGIDNSWELEMKEFADSVIRKKPIINGNIDDAVKVMEIVEGIYSDGYKK